MALTLTLVHQSTSGNAFGTGAYTAASFTPTASRRLLVLAQMAQDTDSGAEGTDLTVSCSTGGVTSFTVAGTSPNAPAGWSYGSRAWISDQNTSGAAVTDLAVDCGAFGVENYRLTVWEVLDYGSVGGTAVGTDADGDGALALTLSPAPVTTSIVVAAVNVTLASAAPASSVTPNAAWTEVSGEDNSRSEWWIFQAQTRGSSTSTAVDWDDINVAGSGASGAVAFAFEIKEAAAVPPAFTRRRRERLVRGRGQLSYDRFIVPARRVVHAGIAPAITLQPTDQAGAVGGTATFNTTVTGATSFQWEHSDDGNTWANAAGSSTSEDYTTPTLTRAEAGDWYRLKATNSNGTTTSNRALLTVTDIPASYAASVGLVVGSSLSFVGASFVGASDAAAGQSAAIGLATEADLAQTLGRLKTKAIAQATETNTAQTISPVRQYAIGIATETDAAQTLGRSKALAIGIAAETDLAQPLTKVKALSLALETDLAQALVRSKALAIAQAVETDAAQTLGRLKAKAIGLVTETDLAQTITAGGEIVVQIGLAAETNLAQSLARSKALAVAHAIETDLSQALARSKARAIAQAIETDLAQALNRLKTEQIGFAPEADLAQALVWAPKIRALAFAGETDLAMALTVVQGGAAAIVRRRRGFMTLFPPRH